MQTQALCARPPLALEVERDELRRCGWQVRLAELSHGNQLEAGTTS
jgi:hypothetical protein